jgi:hypothetical protein
MASEIYETSARHTLEWNDPLVIHPNDQEGLQAIRETMAACAEKHKTPSKQKGEPLEIHPV